MKQFTYHRATQEITIGEETLVFPAAMMAFINDQKLREKLPQIIQRFTNEPCEVIIKR
jgi:hypothetical protein